MTDTHDEVTAKEEGGFARLDRIAIAIAGAGDDEQLLAIGFDLWKLVGLQRIFDRQRMQAEAPGDPFQLAGGRLEQAEPEEVAGIAMIGNGLVRAQLAHELAIIIEAGGLDRHRQTPSTARCR